MVQDFALEIDLEELLSREPFCASDFGELRRELYRAEDTRTKFLRLLDDKFPADGKNAVRRGFGLLAAGRVDDAIPLLEKSKDPLAQYLIGTAMLDRDRPDVALEHLERVADENQPREYRVAYAECLARLGEIDRVREVIAQLSQEDPQSADCAYLEARVHELEGDYDAAMSGYERAVTIQPDHREARFRLAYRLDLMGRDDEAVQHYERLKQVFPVPIGALINLGILYEDAGKYEKAASCFKLALAHDYNHKTARMYLQDAEASLDMYYDEEKERKDDKRAQILKIPVTDFELSVRSRNCLARMNIRTLGDLIRKTEAELLSFKNFGETSLNEIKEILRSKGLRLGTHHDDDDRRGGRRRGDLDKDAVRSKPVSELDLSVRSRKALDHLKVTTVGQLTEVTEEQLMGCKNFGQTSLVEIKKKLADLGLSLRG